MKWNSCCEDVEVRKVELDIESVIVDNVRLSLNDTLEGSVEQEMKEKEMLRKRKEHLSDELEELLALVKAKEKEIDENDSQIKAVEERINSVVSGYKELQTSMDKMFSDLQTGLSQVDAETEGLSRKRERWTSSWRLRRREEPNSVNLSVFQRMKQMNMRKLLNCEKLSCHMCRRLEKREPSL